MSDTARARRLAGSVTTGAGPHEVASAAAARIADLSKRALRDHGHFAVALTGGHTPRLLYQKLAQEPFRAAIAWEGWRVYFGDERCVPPDDPESNYRTAKETLLDHVPIPKHLVHRMPGERDDIDAAAEEYSQLLEGSLRHAGSGAPRFDCILLGLGENGHTASLFPGTPALDVSDRWATRGRADYPPFDRITITFPAINAAATVMFLVTGGKKAAALRDVAAGTVPAARVRPVEGSLLWFLDSDAAKGIA